MDLNTVTDIVRPSAWPLDEPWQPGDVFIAGGTWLFSEPQPSVSRLIDLDACGWTPLTVSEDGLEIGATCKIAALHDFEPPADWRAAPLFRQCCDALLASFKIWNMATVGGNICLSLPAGAMISLATALDASCILWSLDGRTRRVPITEFVTGTNRNILSSGEVMRAISLPATALRRRTAFRQISRTTLGRSAALLIGTLDPSGSFALSVTAATSRPIRLEFPGIPTQNRLNAAIDRAIDGGLYVADMHGSPGYRRRMTYYLAEEIRQDLGDGASE